MLSPKTLLELIKLADKLSHPQVNRIISIFNFTPPMFGTKVTVINKTTKIYNELRYYPERKTGPFTSDIQLDFLQYLIDDFFDNHSFLENDTTYLNPNKPGVTFKNAFFLAYKELGNNLKRDGYIVEGRTIKKLLPAEIEEAKTESELHKLLERNEFSMTIGHLKQATENFVQGNWAAANSQFRSFIESLFIELVTKLLPGNLCSSASGAIKLLSKSVNPAFFKEELNEVETTSNKNPFIESFWKRLHPQGSHPGLSDGDDCAFRYQITMTMAHYILGRFEKRK